MIKHPEWGVLFYAKRSKSPVSLQGHARWASDFFSRNRGVRWCLPWLCRCRHPGCCEYGVCLAEQLSGQLDAELDVVGTALLSGAELSEHDPLSSTGAGESSFSRELTAEGGDQQLGDSLDQSRGLLLDQQLQGAVCLTVAILARLVLRSTSTFVVLVAGSRHVGATSFGSPAMPSLRLGVTTVSLDLALIPPYVGQRAQAHDSLPHIFRFHCRDFTSKNIIILT
ncbi:MAG: hypothetical protein JWP06_697 [Candidatus Saccharibacteria bacterium]|nr:hypothetical protein [Candidatus Saccharibacteria bacterium]